MARSLFSRVVGKLTTRFEAWIDARYASNARFRERFCRKQFFYNAFQALSFNGISGDYLEFGCHSASTFVSAYQEIQRHRHPAHLWAFDSFEGLPPQQDARDEHPAWVAGAMAMPLERFRTRCEARGLAPAAYTVVPGYYEQSLVAESAPALPSDIALAYIDCDLYSSTRDVLAFLEPRLKHGMIVAFDDYFCWSATQISGERRALLELQARRAHWEWTPYLTIGWHGMSFVIEDRGLRGEASPR